MAAPPVDTVSPQLGLACLLVTGCAAPELRPARRELEVTTPPSRSSCDLDRAEPIGSPERMPFGLYSARASDFADLARSGFTTVGPWYVPEPDHALLDAAAAAGLGVIFPIGDPRGRAGGAFERSAAQTHDDIGARVRAVVDHPAVVAWYLLPEELRAWNAGELDYLRTATAAVRAADPQRRPILSYQPNHYDAAALAPVLAHLDVATKGMYANYAGQRDSRAWVRWSVDELEIASDAPAWAVLEMFEDPKGADAETITAWARHDVFAGLVAGARGVLVYSGFRRAGFTRFDDYLAAYRAIAHELNGPLALGDVLMRGTVCPATPVAVIEGSEEVTFRTGATTRTVPTIATVELAFADARWLFVVSSAPRPILVRTPKWSSATLESRSAGIERDGEQLRMPAWGVAVLRRAPERGEKS